MAEKQMNEAVFDTVLEQAFADAFERDLQELAPEVEACADIRPTEKQRKEARRAYKKAQRGPKWRTVVVQRIAIAVLVLFCLGSGLIMSNPNVCAAIKDTVIGFFEKYFSLDFSDNTKEYIQVGDYLLGYVPDGFELVSETHTDNLQNFTLSDGNSTLRIRITESQVSDHNVDCENYEKEGLDIPGYSAYKFTPITPNTDNIIIVGNQTISIKFQSVDIAMEEMEKIAQNLN